MHLFFSVLCEQHLHHLCTQPLQTTPAGSHMLLPGLCYSFIFSMLLSYCTQELILLLAELYLENCWLKVGM